MALNVEHVLHEFPVRPPTQLVEVISFWADGLPIQQGSKIAMMPRGHKRPIVMESVSKELRAWRRHVGQLAEVEMAASPHGIIEKPDAAKVWVQFVMARPKGLSANKPTRLCNVMPDLDKLQRAIGDALTGICYADDGLVNAWHAEKYTAEVDEPVGAKITVYREELLDV